MDLSGPGYRVRLSLRVAKPSPRIHHDWEAFSRSPDLQARYTVEVRNHFQLLATEEGPSTVYERFVTAKVEATRECVPTTERIRVSPRSRHLEVVQARAKVEEARRSFDRERTTERRGVLNEAKQLLFSTYDKIKGELLMEKVRRVEAAQGEQQYGESWRVINEMSGCKRSNEGQVAGCSPVERVISWFTHFRDLLGTHLTVDGAEKVITAVLTNLEIDDGPFTLREFATVKSTLKQGKSAGPDGIPPEVLKNCDFDDIILEISNLALMENNKPDICKLSVLIDEATSLSHKSAMIVNLKASVNGVPPEFVFLELVKLESQRAEDIEEALLNCLDTTGFTEEWLQKNWVSFVSDGASVMLGKNSGVATRLKARYPNLFTWHCMNHRLELAVSNAVDEVQAVNHFKVFIEKIHNLYSQSNKNSRELLETAQEMGSRVLKI
ncbi:hypothetical protein AAFF_G00409590 [Aldrovandia affinis]|uniref:Uncharacterized protein n=1 Tax=Aldrovandia affinis TaxID=143900 RepID=A0AAD7SC25_9TELE|nr:hypothetical protein AAFF_G00409590 [Aldrovandia affinis]